MINPMIRLHVLQGQSDLIKHIFLNLNLKHFLITNKIVIFQQKYLYKKKLCFKKTLSSKSKEFAGLNF